jgi:hypothetical protein
MSHSKYSPSCLDHAWLDSCGCRVVVYSKVSWAVNQSSASMFCNRVCATSAYPSALSSDAHTVTLHDAMPSHARKLPYLGLASSSGSLIFFVLRFHYAVFFYVPLQITSIFHPRFKLFPSLFFRSVFLFFPLCILQSGLAIVLSLK